MGIKIITENRKARFDYQILEDFEAGLVLKGSELKSLREGQCQLKDSYICLLYTSPSPRDQRGSRMPSSA